MRSLATLLLIASSLSADPTPSKTPNSPTAAELVKQLGHPRFAQREFASKRLLELGDGALAALQEGSQSADPEIRERCEALLPKAKIAAWSKRAKQYLESTETKAPLEEEFAKLLGKKVLDKGDRELFSEMIRTNGDLLEQVAADRKKGEVALVARCKILLNAARVEQKQLDLPYGDIASLLFVHSLLPKTAFDNNNSKFSPMYLLSNPALMTGMSSKTLGTTFRQLVVKWSESRPVGDAAQQKIVSAIRKKPFPEAAPILMRIAKDKSGNDMFTRAIAIEAMGQLKGDEVSAALIELVDDNTTLIDFGMNNTYSVGDSAIAALATLHGKKVSDYGMTSNTSIGFSRGDEEETVMLNLHGFQNKEEREKVAKKLKADIAKKK